MLHDVILRRYVISDMTFGLLSCREDYHFMVPRRVPVCQPPAPAPAPAPAAAAAAAAAFATAAASGENSGHIPRKRWPSLIEATLQDYA